MKSKFISSTLAVLLVAAGAVALPTAANATGGGYPPEECVPKDAWVEVVPDIEHPAVGEPKILIDNPDYKPATEGTAAIWANFSPNDQQGTFVGPPLYPVDERGTWHDHGQLPPGQAGPDGVYANGNPDKGGNWFYRQAAVPGTPAVGDPKIEVDNPYYVKPWTEVIPDIEHPAVTCEEEPPVVINECVPGAGVHSTNLDDKWTNVDTRSKGHLEYVENGLHIWTEDNSSQAKVSEGIARSFALKNTGVLDLDWTGTSPAPGINLFVNFGADGNGTLVYEEVYGQDLWLTNGSSAAVKANAPVNGGGNGSQWHGTINQWLEKYPDATVTGIAYSLGSGVLGDGVINSITVNCSVFTFDYEQEVQQDAKFDVGIAPATCTDGETLQYGPENFTNSTVAEGSTLPGTEGPNEFSVTGVADEGHSFVEGQVNPITGTLDGPLGYQDEDPEAPCYVEPREDEEEVVNSEYTVTCDNEVGDEVPSTDTIETTSWTLDTVTGELLPASSTRTVEGVHVVTQEDIDALDCPAPPSKEDDEENPVANFGSLAATGPVGILAALALVVVLGASGTAAVLRDRARNRRLDSISAE